MANLPDKYDLLSEIRKDPLQKMNVGRRDPKARKVLEELTITGPRAILPGQLAAFEYRTPMMKEELEYYDASPVTLFFGLIDTPEGKRVIGWNIHYYPPKIRYQLTAKVLDMFRDTYSKYWDKAVDKEISQLEYHKLLSALRKAKLDFGVRMYDPSLMAKIRPIPVEHWKEAVFTEGRFMKKTRDLIMKYWANHL